MKRASLLLATAAVAVALKVHFARAEVDDLRWMLAPTARLASWLSGVSFAYEPGAGYLSQERMFLIEKPCAGVNFLIAAVLVSGIVASASASVRRLGLVLVASYAVAVMTNALRIAGALWLAAHHLAGAQVHRVEGVIVYFGSLAAYYAYLEGRTYLVPLSAYYGVTLVFPLATGVPIPVAHAAVVALVPLLLVALAVLVTRGRRASYPPPRASAAASASLASAALPSLASAAALPSLASASASPNPPPSPASLAVGGAAASPWQV